MKDGTTLTGKKKTKDFTVVVYQLIANAATDKVYPIQGNTVNYQFPEFTCSYCSDAGYNTVTYSLEDTSTGNDAQPTYSAWMTTFDAATRTITYVTSNIVHKG